MEKITFNDRQEIIDWCRNNLTTKEKMAVLKRRDIAYRKNNRGGGQTINCFVFSMHGELIGRDLSIKEAANFIGIKDVAVYSAITRKSLVRGMYYVSRQPTFTPPKPKKYNRNPLLRPVDI